MCKAKANKQKGEIKMKKIIIVGMLVLVIASSMCGCKGVGQKCDSCGKTVWGSSNEYEFFGETVILCDECFGEY